MNDMEMKAKIGQKILSVMKSIGKMEKDGKNTQSHYDYISSEAMLSRLKAVLPEHGLAILPTATDIEEEHFTSAKGQKIQRTRVKMNFQIMDTDTGFIMELPWVGADEDYGGKSCGQALTEGCKRFYFKLFFVSSLEDKDPDSKTTEVELREKYSRDKKGFMNFLVDNGLSVEEVKTVAHKTLGDNPTDEDVRAWVKRNGWDSSKVRGL